jgi:hypothetical protein
MGDSSVYCVKFCRPATPIDGRRIEKPSHYCPVENFQNLRRNRWATRRTGPVEPRDGQPRKTPEEVIILYPLKATPPSAESGENIDYIVSTIPVGSILADITPLKDTAVLYTLIRFPPGILPSLEACPFTLLLVP